jgi:hypothetical protein
MQEQEFPLNGDTIACEEIIRLRDQFRITDVIETGTCFGSTTGFFADNFKCVTTTEINPKFHQIAKYRLRGRENVVCLYGDSLIFMDALAKNAKERHDKMAIQTLFLLDDHWLEQCPLLSELSAIAAAKFRPVIVIHDVQSPHNPELGFDTYGGQAFTYEWLKPSLDSIYGANGYDYTHNTTATGAKRGILYVTPKT